MAALKIVEFMAIDVRGEPLWRIVAYWLVIVTFFTLPLVALGIRLTGYLIKVDFKADDFRFIAEFFRVLAAMLAVMLGLNSWDKRSPNGHNGK